MPHHLLDLLPVQASVLVLVEPNEQIFDDLFEAFVLGHIFDELGSMKHFPVALDDEFAMDSI